MYDAIKNVITSGRFELADLLGKMDKLWLQGSLTEAEHDELVALARAKHDPAGGYASLEQQLHDLRVRVDALEQAQAGDTEDAPTVDEYPAYKQPTHAGDAYYAGAKMTWTDGKRYVCTAPEGYAVTYGPDVLPNFWELIAE